MKVSDLRALNASSNTDSQQYDSLADMPTAQFHTNMILTYMCCKGVIVKITYNENICSKKDGYSK